MLECPKCKASNREGRRFCSACGGPLSKACAGCGFENDLGERFCGGCGKALDAAPAAPAPGSSAAVPSPSAPASPPPPESPDAERRQVTVLFCDLVGSTGLSGRLDPEEMRELLAQYQQACAVVVAHYQGYIARYIGDGLLVYFGYPQAHEDDPQSAVRSALRIIKVIRKLGRKYASTEVKLAVRIGIATGLVVVGDIGFGDRREQNAIVGETPNLAARLQSLAEPNTVVIANSTHRLVEGLFQYEDLGPQSLKGIAEPVRAFRVFGKSDAPTRFEAAAQRGLTPIVGREEETAFLLKRWQLALDGEAQVVLLEGEAGIGKSRLLRGFRERIEAVPHSRLLYQGSPYHQQSAFYCVIDQLERGMRFGRDDRPEEKLAKLEATLRDLGIEVAQGAPLLAGLLSLPAQGYPAPDLTPEQLKRKTLELLAAMVKRMAQQRPVLIVAEDLHWFDPSSIEMLTVLVEQLRACSLLLIGSSRPGAAPPWKTGDHISRFSLTRLSRRECAAIVDKLTRGKALPEEVLQQIMAKTGGIPLFVEELTKMVLESGLLEEQADRFALSGPLPELAIPASLQDSLMARLDRLAPVKELAQLAASLGRTFSHELIAAVSPLGADKLDDALAQLIRAELLYRHGTPPDVSYEFKHALVRDAAYQSMLKSTRQVHHQRIARVLEERFPGTVEAQPELLAQHYAEARLTEQAIAYWQKAGARAVASCANLEAMNHLRKALESLQSLPAGPQRDQQELQLQLMLAVPLTATSGYAANDVERVYSRAHKLCQALGGTAQLFPSLYGLWRYYLLRAEYSRARELAQQLLGLAESAGESVLRLAAHRALGATLFYLGELTQSQDHLEQVSALETATSDGGSLLQRTHDVADPQIASRSYASWGLRLLGQTGRAAALSRATAALAEQRAHPFSSALALSFAAWQHQFARDAHATRERAEAGLQISTERSFPFWIGWNMVLRGWALSVLEPGQAAVSEIQQGLASWRMQGSALGSAYFLALLADVHARRGEAEEGLKALDEARRFSERTGERFWYAEQCRLRGELLLLRGPSQQAEANACFLESLEVARGQKAKLLELRAAVSLGRMCSRNGKSTEARALLAEAYGWFKEDSQSTDMVEARALLEALA